MCTIFLMQDRGWVRATLLHLLKLIKSSHKFTGLLRGESILNTPIIKITLCGFYFKFGGELMF